MMVNPVDVLQKGREILEEVMKPHGFEFQFEGAGPSSGGNYARGSFVRGDRRLELHVRDSLGLVTYHLGSLAIGHTDLIECVAGLRNEAQYPGVSDDPLDGFRHLKGDLERYCGDFLTGPGMEFQGCARGAPLKPKGFVRLAAIEAAAKPERPGAG